MGKLLALKQLYGDWDINFDNLYRFKAQVESCCPGSIVQIDHHTINGKIRFRRIFVAMKPCIERFLSGCRPYLAIEWFLSGQHLCPICKEYGHHWHKCKKGNREDIAAMMAVREPPKKRTKTTKTAELSIVPCEDGVPTRMCFPPSLETTKKGKHVNSSAGASKSKSLENTNKKGKGGKSESVDPRG
uniref:Uncharacterized protein n=1 Tax=Aegilops tauschii subsp. strangulata TaxID=200361 RepID=A0A453RMD6_AEGTS